jgi:CheY-like chemotaxis protein
MSDTVVLIVEDQYDHAVMIQAMLDYRHLAQRTRVASSLAEGQSYLRGEWPFIDRLKDPIPDLIILDHWLPDGTGLDLLEWLALEPSLHTIPVVVFTACEDPAVERQVLDLGVKAYIRKVKGFDELAQAIEDLQLTDNHEAWVAQLQADLKAG